MELNTNKNKKVNIHHTQFTGLILSSTDDFEEKLQKINTKEEKKIEEENNVKRDEKIEEESNVKKDEKIEEESNVKKDEKIEDKINAKKDEKIEDKVDIENKDDDDQIERDEIFISNPFDEILKLYSIHENRNERNK
ncbi:hypothetical protein [Abyssisolibacter fermentans]|uniref:hypothetical protein n=1 Tax=Abyssisolibacter fermentans TaxID=1766203 RepID=UPI00082AC515|nr:hypothetical protein [Abyssisolibacter fermentans]